MKISNTNETDSSTLEASCFRLINAHKTLLLSSYSEQRGAEISYAPYVRDGFNFYIYVSDLAGHTGNLLTTLQGAVMFIQPETDAGNLFARERVIFNCEVLEVERDHELYEQQLQAMRQKFGETVDLLRSLSDFHLLQLKAFSGQYVAGFGRAYTLDLDNQVFRLQKTSVQKD